MAELGLLHCWSTFPAVPRENARKTDKALVKLISKITKINYPDGILSSFEEIGRLPGPPPFRLDPGAVAPMYQGLAGQPPPVKLPDLPIPGEGVGEVEP